MQYYVFVNKPDSSIEAYLNGLPCRVQQQIKSYDSNVDELREAMSFRFDNEHYANNAAAWLASKFPESEVSVSEVKVIYQSEVPKVSKKIVSEQGILPS